jgi:hypothetical protein
VPRATWVTAITPPPPGRWSTTNGLPSRCSSFCPMTRAINPVEPPAANGTTKVTGRFG